MKILLLTKSFTKGGSASGASNLAIALETAGAEVVRCDAYASTIAPLSRVLRFLERATERLMYDAETHCLGLGPPVFDLPALYEQHRPDIVQLCDVSGNVIRFADLDRIPCPVVHRMSDFWPYNGAAHYATSPGTGPASAQWLLHQTLFDGNDLPDMRVAPSYWLADLLSANAGSSSPIRVVRNAVAIPALVHRRTPAPGTLHFGYLSNSIMDPRKGFTVLPPVLQALAASGIKVSLHLHGRINDAQHPEITGVEVVNHGSFKRNGLRHVFDSFDILLCPSRVDNSPNVLSEALAHGRPVIAQLGTGMDSYVTPATGMLLDFYVDEKQAKAAFVDACLQLACAYPAFSQSAADYAADQLSPAAIGAAYKALYKELRS